MSVPSAKVVIQQEKEKSKMLKDVKTAKATIELYDWSLTIEGGVLGESSTWTVTNQNSVKLFGSMATSRSWTIEEYFSDEEELEKFAWDEFMAITRKYNYCSIEVTETQVECCDECEEPKDDCYC
jgi:hypothetical protein